MQDAVLQQIRELGIKYHVEKILLFGSRARGDHSPVSDYDFAIWADDLSPIEKATFCCDVEEFETLKKIDIVFIDASVSAELLRNIETEGIAIV